MAKEIYNSGNSNLKEVALQAYTEKELTAPKFTDIKTFEDACEALGIKDYRFELSFKGNSKLFHYEHMEAILKLEIIRKALNGDWEPRMAGNDTYCPYIRIDHASRAEETAKYLDLKVKETFIADGKKYSLICGDTTNYGCTGCTGLCNYTFEDAGEVSFALGLLCCKSEEIAEHMSLYFGKEIFEACYAHHIGAYKWV